MTPARCLARGLKRTRMCAPLSRKPLGDLTLILEHTSRTSWATTYLKPFGLHVSGFTTSPYGVEWMRFENDSPLHELIRNVPHVAFEVDDLDAALEGQEIIHPPGSPSDGDRSAMIVHNGAPVEFIWFRKRHDIDVGQAPCLLDPPVA